MNKNNNNTRSIEQLPVIDYIPNQQTNQPEIMKRKSLLPLPQQLQSQSNPKLPLIKRERNPPIEPTEEDLKDDLKTIIYQLTKNNDNEKEKEMMKKKKKKSNWKNQMKDLFESRYLFFILFIFF